MSIPDTAIWVTEIGGDFAFVDPFARFTEIVGKKITEITTDDEGYAILFKDGSRLCIWDGGQDCCESRYMTCDDDLTGHQGGQIVSINSDAGGDQPAEEDHWGCHEVRFVKVQTTKGSFTICSHNEHNGYYGGFALKLKLVR
jgi:hypothetical protein